MLAFPVGNVRKWTNNPFWAQAIKLGGEEVALIVLLIFTGNLNSLYTVSVDLKYVTIFFNFWNWTEICWVFWKILFLLLKNYNKIVQIKIDEKRHFPFLLQIRLPLRTLSDNDCLKCTNNFFVSECQAEIVSDFKMTLKSSSFKTLKIASMISSLFSPSTFQQNIDLFYYRRLCLLINNLANKSND